MSSDNKPASFTATNLDPIIESRVSGACRIEVRYPAAGSDSINISATLLVVLMFSSIVGIGIANILMTFAGHVSTFATLRGRRFAVAWLLILLLTYLDMFWKTTLLIRREDWQYSLFLFVILGPVLLLFASSLLTSLMTSGGEEALPALRDRVLVRFFLIYAGVHAWFIGMDYVIGKGWGTASAVSAVLLIAATGLALARNQSVVPAFTVAVLALSAVDVFLG